MPRTKGLLLSNQNKQFIKYNCASFTAKQLAEHFHVSISVIGTFCRYHKLKCKKHDPNDDNNHIESEYFNIDHFKGIALFIG